MNNSIRLAALALVAAFIAASCGGGDDAVPPSPPAPPPGPAGPTSAERIAAATATAGANPMCLVGALGSYYWEVGDGDGVKASGSVGDSAPTATTEMAFASSSKWLYAAYVIEKRGVLAEDAPFLNFTSGYTQFGLPTCGAADTVQECLVGRDGRDAATIGKYFYDSGHMQQHAAAVMNLGPADEAALAAELRTTLGDFAVTYGQPQLAAGARGTPQGFAGFLRRILRGELVMGGALGSYEVCANPQTCSTAVSGPELGESRGESWSYSLGHWVENDPVVGDRAFSSAGGTGFYPWIASDKTHYGIVARERNLEADAGYHSAECGRLIRQAWMTGAQVTSTAPVPLRAEGSQSK